MVGQTRLLKTLNSFNIDNFPRSVLIVGEDGSGKHLIVNYISENIVRLPVVDISTIVSDEVLDNIYRNPNPSIYLIDLSEITEKEQNVLLKFVEEPMNNTFVILLAESRNLVLNTIYNRCITFDMDPYSKDELLQFIEKPEEAELLLHVLRTPGKILASSYANMVEMQNVCDKIVNKLIVASYPNTLSVANKINYKDEYSKFDLLIFIDALNFSLFSAYLKTNNKNIYKMYSFTREQRKKLLDKRLNKQLFTEYYLSQLWQIAREVS